MSSNAQALGRIDFDDLQGIKDYSGPKAYNQSKLANIMSTYELSRRLDGTGVTANALHPGAVSTSFGAEDPTLLTKIARPLMRYMKSPTQGAATSIYLASSPDVGGTTGRFFANSKPKTSSKTSYDDDDDDATKRLWQVSADLVACDKVGRRN